MSGGVELGENRLHDFLVARFGGADEIVVGQAQFRGERLPTDGQFIAVGLRGFALGVGGLLDFLAMLVEAGQEKNLLAERAAGAGDDVRDDLFVGVAEMRLAVHVVDRGGQVKAFAHGRGVCPTGQAVASLGCAAVLEIFQRKISRGLGADGDEKSWGMSPDKMAGQSHSP